MADEACKHAAQLILKSKNARQMIKSTIRNGRGCITLLNRSFHFDKSYILNRFSIYLLKAYFDKTPHYKRKNKVCMKIIFGSQISKSIIAGRKRYIKVKLSSNKKQKIKNSATKKTTMRYDNLVIRFGIQKGSIPGCQMLHVTPPIKKTQYTSLKRVEQPFITMSTKNGSSSMDSLKTRTLRFLPKRAITPSEAVPARIS
jgi:hypothetical protein